jgi:hypothetical protein
MVELGEAEVFKGQVTQALDGVVGGKALFSNLLEELAKGFSVHSGTGHCSQFSVPGSQFSVKTKLFILRT